MGSLEPLEVFYPFLFKQGMLVFSNQLPMQLTKNSKRIK